MARSAAASFMTEVSEKRTVMVASSRLCFDRAVWARKVRMRCVMSAPSITVRKVNGKRSGTTSSPNRLFSKQLDAYTRDF